MIKLLRNDKREPVLNKDGRFIITNGNAFLTIGREDFRQLRAELADIETREEHKRFMAIAESTGVINQCDGCAAGMPKNSNNIHKSLKTGLPVMTCQAHRYKNEP